MKNKPGNKKPILTIWMKNKKGYEKLRVSVMTKLWVMWNKKEITAKTFVSEFGRLYNKECLEAWNVKK